MITDIEQYFVDGCGRCDRFATADCSARRWSAGLLALRKICNDAGLVETVKWGQPCYTHADRNIAIFGAFREDFRLSFFNAALMKDPQGVLEKQGSNTPHADMIRFTDVAQVKRLMPTIAAYLEEAMGYAEAGVKPSVTEQAIDLPDELTQAFQADPDFETAFFALTPGRRRGYAINLNSAKKPETRIARIAKFRDKIIAGKGATER
ncbi:MAG: YdeI/OmpD-associated family protein [Phycisphaeraceae bacterium]